MLAYPRFHCPSASLSLKSLLIGTRRTLWIGWGLALVIHLLLTQLAGSRAEQKVAKPLTIQFVKRQPRLTKPLEMKKHPRPKQRRIQRKMVSVKAKADRQRMSSRIRSMEVVQNLATPRVSISRTVSSYRAAEEPEALAQDITGQKEANDSVDMSLEMVDIETLDTGKYQAMVIQDPNDKRNIKGFLHLAIAYPLTMRNQNVAEADSRARYGIIRLVRALNEYTGIRADTGKNVTFDDRELLKTPWIHLRTMSSFRLTESECLNFGKYLTHGGFYFGTTGRSQQGVISSYWGGLRPMVIDALNAVHVQYQRDWDFQILPNDHPIYHCFFEFDGAPMPYRTELGGGRYIEGVFYEDRLVALVNGADYAVGFADWGNPNSNYNQGQATMRVVQFGVNSIIFALTQEGSITNRVMDSVGY